MLLPHGYDGQGPEHSSARLERYLQLCAQDNIIVANLTSPAQYFHILRRQIYQPYKMPLIMVTPKGMLRHPLAVAPIEDFINGKFEHIIDDKAFAESPQKARKLLLCSGKIYFELMTEVIKRKIDDVAIVRIEQFYPFNSEQFTSIVSRFSNIKNIYWIQEEPKNMGAWLFIKDIIADLLDEFKMKLHFIGRAATASTATGLSIIHQREQKKVIDDALS